MNGIIHECSHNDTDLSLDPNFEEIFDKVLSHLDYFIQAIKPQKLVYVAIDGIAPRAKLNQQRSRRFRSAKTNLIEINKICQGLPSNRYFDSNCITPGTVFMQQLGERIKHYIQIKLSSSNSEWGDIAVHFSGSDVPGEGEHKIISFIRSWRSSTEYTVNTRHCIYGADADMIMLSLATHEPFILVLRDMPQPFRPSKIKSTQRSSKPFIEKKMLFIRINILREYLINELLEDLDDEKHVVFDSERLIDDFVFLTFLVGNDFLPHLPAIDIGDGAFDIILDAYKTVLASALTGNDDDYDDNILDDGGGRNVNKVGLGLEDLYLVSNGNVHVGKLNMMFALMSVNELSLYQNNEIVKEIKRLRHQQRNSTKQNFETDNSAKNNAENDKNVSNTKLLSIEDEHRYRYYLQKLHIDILTEEGQEDLRKLGSSYLQGLCWCLQYYSRGMALYTPSLFFFSLSLKFEVT